MPVHVFVDESKSRGLLMAAAQCSPDEVTVSRTALRGLLLPGQERLHFNHETESRRKQILGLVIERDESTRDMIGGYSTSPASGTGASICGGS